MHLGVSMYTQSRKERDDDEEAVGAHDRAHTEFDAAFRLRNRGTEQAGQRSKQHGIEDAADRRLALGC